MEVALLASSSAGRVDDATTDAPPTPLRLGAGRVAPPAAAVTHVVLPAVASVRRPPNGKWCPSTRPPSTAPRIPAAGACRTRCGCWLPTHNDLGIVTTDGAQVPCAGAQAAPGSTLREDRRPARCSSLSTHVTSSGAATTDLLSLSRSQQDDRLRRRARLLATSRSKRRNATASPSRRRSCAAVIPISSTATSRARRAKRSNSSTAAWSSATPEPSRRFTAKCWRRCPRAGPTAPRRRRSTRTSSSTLPRAVARARLRPRLHCRTLGASAPHEASVAPRAAARPLLASLREASLLRASQRRRQVDAARLRQRTAPLRRRRERRRWQGRFAAAGVVVVRGTAPPPPPPPPSPPSPSVARSVERAEPRHDLGPMGVLFPPMDPQQQPPPPSRHSTGCRAQRSRCAAGSSTRPASSTTRLASIRCRRCCRRPPAGRGRSPVRRPAASTATPRAWILSGGAHTS